jgi:hypothetical protein
VSRRLPAALLVAALGVATLAAADEQAAARLNQEGNRLYREGKHEEALGRYAEALAADPASPVVRYPCMC